MNESKQKRRSARSLKRINYDERKNEPLVEELIKPNSLKCPEESKPEDDFFVSEINDSEVNKENVPEKVTKKDENSLMAVCDLFGVKVGFILEQMGIC